MTERKRDKARKRWKNYQKKRNIIQMEMKEIKNGIRKSHSLQFPKPKKIKEKRKNETTRTGEENR